jgi:hypothetical protein
MFEKSIGKVYFKINLLLIHSHFELDYILIHVLLKFVFIFYLSINNLNRKHLSQQKDQIFLIADLL